MKIRQHVINFGVYVRFHEQSINDHTRELKEKTWNEGWDAIMNKVPLARQNLEQEFHVLLGAAANNSSKPTPGGAA